MKNDNIFQIEPIKISEIANLTKQKVPAVSRYFKNHNSDELKKLNNRIIGVSSNEVEKYLTSIGHDYFFKPSIIMFSNLCGGVGKTSGINNVSAFIRRITSTDRPIVLIDADSQASLTELLYGEMADENEPVLIDFIENRVDITDIISKCNNNIYCIKSNFNLSAMDKILSTAIKGKKAMLKVYDAIFNLFPNAYILQDNGPSLGALFASSVAGLYQLNDQIHKSIMIPIRSDKTAINGADKVLKEIEDIVETYSFQNNVPIHCYFACIDKRVTTTFESIQEARKKERVLNTLAGPYIRYSAEIVKNLNHGTNLYTNKKTNHAALDFGDLVQYIYRGKNHA